jgi:hypothetical protein
MRAARLRREARDRRWGRMRNKERARPIEERQYFSVAEIAEQLSRDSRSLTIDPELRERIVEELVAWVQNRQFTAEEVGTLSGARARFQPLKLALGAILVSNSDALFLRCEACVATSRQELNQWAPSTCARLVWRRRHRARRHGRPPSGGVQARA